MLSLKKKHLKLRELEGYAYQCSLVGTCLTLKELRIIGRKAKLMIPHNICDFDLHGRFVSVAKNTTTYAHHQLQKYLDKKYKRSIQIFSRANTEQEIRELWANAVESADIAGAYYALTTHTGTPPELLDEVFGDIHMLSHISGASMRIDMQKHLILKQRVIKLDSLLANKEKNIHTHVKTIQGLNQQLLYVQQLENKTKLQLEKEVAANDPARIIDLVEQVDKLSKSLNILQKQSLFFADKASHQKAQVKQVELSNTSMSEQLFSMTRERDNLEQTLAGFLQPVCSETCSKKEKLECESMDLCGKCILYVGGRSKQYRHFRSLVEHYNGRLIHHDGGLEESGQRLTTILSQADTVMCPLNCISHAAMITVKQHCKNNTKSLVMIPKSSLSAFSKGLSEVTPH